MLDNIFTSSPAVWFGLLASLAVLPPLIHLINLMRHKRVKWAAMEFLLTSHKKNRNWVWLKQLFLLLSRIAALLLLLFLLGQVGCENDRVTRFLGGSATHHYVLLDDSFSMQDRAEKESAFDRALATLNLISARAKDRPNQRFTIIRFSKARFGMQSSQTDSRNREVAAESDKVQEIGNSGVAFADLDAELVDSRFDQRIEAVKAELNVTAMSVGPQDAIEVVERLIDSRRDENAIVYIVSDFRNQDWSDSALTDAYFEAMTPRNVALELISCADNVNSNLAVTQLAALGNVRAAGTPLMMRVTVKNCGNSVAKNIQLDVKAEAYRKAVAGQRPEELLPNVEELPTVFIPKIEPGRSETVPFPVFFRSAGQHVVTVELPNDSVHSDNTARAVIDFATSAKVLIVDNQEQRDGGFLSLALNPGGMTGIESRIRTRDYLRDTTPQELDEFDVVFLLDIDQLDETAVTNLEQFVRGGGGLCTFLGPSVIPAFYNAQLYQSGAGLIPMPLDQEVLIPEQIEDQVPDVSPEVHPIFEPVLGVKNSLLGLVQIKRVYRPTREWILDQSNSEKSIEAEGNSSLVVATVRGDAELPLMVEGRYGNGRTLMVTTTAGPAWNNWLRNATFPPTLLLIEDRLAGGRYQNTNRTTGSEFSVDISSESYSPNAIWVVPSGDDSNPRLAIETKLSTKEGERLAGRLANAATESDENTFRPGVYEVWLDRLDATKEVRRMAVNVDSLESEMDVANRQQLLSQLSRLKARFSLWNQFNPEPEQKSATTLTKFLFFLLITCLAVEQVLAYLSSYHPKRSSKMVGTQ